MTLQVGSKATWATVMLDDDPLGCVEISLNAQIIWLFASDDNAKEATLNPGITAD
jgi:hypothetical protein